VSISRALSRWWSPIDVVEDVEDADELRADRREPQPLRLAARQRRRRTIERQIADANVVEERQPLADLLRDRWPISSSVGVSSGCRGSRARVTDSCVNAWIERSPTVTASTSGFSRAPLQTGHGRSDILLDPLALRGRVRLLVAARGADAMSNASMYALPPHAVAVLHVIFSPSVPWRKRPAPPRSAPTRLRRVDLVAMAIA
jgi:hypothetical protein